MNNKLEEFLGGFKLGEIIHKNEIDTQKNKNCALKCVIITLSILLVILAAIFVIYKFATDKLDDYDEFDDDFDDDFLFDDDDDADTEDLSTEKEVSSNDNSEQDSKEE